MSNLETIEREVQRLSAEDLQKFRAWFAEYDARLWDSQIEADSTNGRFDALIREALTDHKAGRSREL